MPQQIAIELNEDIGNKILEIPSATTYAERQLALHYLAAIWDGTGNVFENGPLLGGSTRALALGMQYNEKREKDSLLWTYDWFSLNQPLDLPDDVWDILIADGLLTREEVDSAHRGGTFLGLFESLHKDESYASLLRPHVGYLPGHRDEKAPDGAWTFEAPDREFGIAYIDGCKSWYGTKFWFQQIAPRLLPNADILFQDFGHYTCFWLPMLIGTFREHFELQAYVDYTYIWRLKSAPTEAEIEEAFPDEPTDLSKDAYDKILKPLHQEAQDRGDRYDVLLLEMQRAAAYAYIGLKDESREILDALLMQAEWFPLRTYLKQARISPTYTPEGRIEL